MKHSDALAGCSECHALQGQAGRWRRGGGGVKKRGEGKEGRGGEKKGGGKEGGRKKTHSHTYRPIIIDLLRQVT